MSLNTDYINPYFIYTANVPHFSELTKNAAV